MITVWRLVPSPHPETALSGEGAAALGSRFNSKGRNVVYAAGSLSLAMLELLVQAGNRSRLLDYVCIPIGVNASVIQTAELADLPNEWDSKPHVAASQQFGDRWLDEARSLVLRVPSVVIPSEHNYLINPVHPDFAKLQIGPPSPAPFDTRLLGPT